MAWINKQFDRYLLSYGTGREDGVIATIGCYTSTPWRHVGQLVFYTDNVPPNLTTEIDFPRLHFSTAQFNDIINILRYEKPLFLRMNTDTRWGDLATSSEEIGEQEP